MASKMRLRIPKMPGTLGEIGIHHKKVLNNEQKKWMKAYYSVTPNEILMKQSGISNMTLHRFANELKLKKDKDALSEIYQWSYATKGRITCEKNGWYDHMRQTRKMNEACLKKNAELRAKGLSPITNLREHDPKRYRKMMREKSKQRKAAIRRDRIRIEYGMKPKHNFHIPTSPFTKKNTALRYFMKQEGYILGDMREAMGERWIIYYDDQTERHPIHEQHAKEQGFSIQPLTD